MDIRDVSSVVGVHVAAFEAFFLTTLGPRFVRRYYSAALEDESAVAFVAFDRSDLTGFVLGSVDPSGFYGRLLRRHSIGFMFDAMPAIIRNPRIMVRLWRAQQKPREFQGADDAGAVFSFAVAPAQQRSGIGAALLKCLEGEMIARGAHGVVLETDAADNQSVRSFYEKVGFVAVRRYETPEGRQMIEFQKSLDDSSEGV